MEGGSLSEKQSKAIHFYSPFEIALPGLPSFFSSVVGEQRKQMKPVEFLRLIAVQVDLGVSVSVMAWGHWDICQGG